jgi:hypothetical protein
MVQILCTDTCKWKNDICWNYSQNGGRGGMKKNGGGGKNFCKCHNVPLLNTTYIYIYIYLYIYIYIYIYLYIYIYINWKKEKTF